MKSEHTSCRRMGGYKKSGASLSVPERTARRRLGTTREIRLLIVVLIFSLAVSVTASSGSPYSHQRWGVARISSPGNSRAFPSHVLGAQGGQGRSISFISAARVYNDHSIHVETGEEKAGKNELKAENKLSSSMLGKLPPRGGQGSNNVVKVVGTMTEVLVQCGRLVLPPSVALVQFIVNVYRALPMDAIAAQVGLVYCFAGGYYPTLFSSLQAAQHCGWNIMVQAIQDLTDEALRVISALEDVNTSQYGLGDDDEEPKIKRQRSRNQFRRRTSVVFATVDPMKINQAAGALYTTWLGVSSVLEKEYARVITLSMTMARYIEKVARFIFAPPAYLCVAEEYHQWVPVVIGWGCKGLAMNIAWRIQRLMTAATSAVTGGLLFARATSRMLSKRGFRLFGLIREDHESTAFDEIIGFMVAGLGFYTQFEAQWRNGFSFQVPFPFYLVTWPFDIAEKWIQWQITK